MNAVIESQRAAIPDVLEILQAHTAPSRALDAAIMALFYERGRRHIGTEEDSGPRGTWVPVEDEVWIDPVTDRWVTTAVQGVEFTSSLDAAVKLVERVLPGQPWSLSSVDFEGRPYATIRVSPLLSIAASEATPALALVGALLAALCRPDAVEG